jgi:hypothetical protein
MSKARGSSRIRSITRAGLSKLDPATGQIKKRPFSNKKAKTQSGKLKYHFEAPTMTVERENGKLVTVPYTVTKGYTRRVFPNHNGNYPIDARPMTIRVGGTDEKPITKEIMVITDTKEVSVPTERCTHINNPEGTKTDDEKAYWAKRQSGMSAQEIYDAEQELNLDDITSEDSGEDDENTQAG